MTWNCENLKNNIYPLKDVIKQRPADLIFLTEPNIFQSDQKQLLSHLHHQYKYCLNTDDLHDPDLAMTRCRMVGGTLILWAVHLDPFTTIYTPKSSSHTAIILQIPGYQTNIHVCIYLPTSGREQDFVTELSNLQSTLTDLSELYQNCAIFVRGDSNVNKNNINRVILLNHFMKTFSLLRVPLHHSTYHHFVGNGQYDSEIDVLLYSHHPDVAEVLTDIRCTRDYPDMLSHHDILLSVCSIPVAAVSDVADDSLVTAPRLTNTRERIVWSPDGISNYELQVSKELRNLRQVWLDPGSQDSMSILLQMTNHVLTKTASATNKCISLAKHPAPRDAKTPRTIKQASLKLKRAHRHWKKASPQNLPAAKTCYSAALKHYKQAVRRVRLQQNARRDIQLLSILGDKPSSLFSFIRSSRSTTNTLTDKLTVGSKNYYGDRVPDGFFDAMTGLKTYKQSELEKDKVAEQLSLYEHIIKLCQHNKPIPPIDTVAATKLLSRLKKNVKDFYSITALHYINAGDEGIQHFQALINAIIQDVKNATIDELNIAHGIILFKGHKKDKTNERSYRCISSCPFLSKAIDLYFRDLHQQKWDKCQASTQYQGTGSSHDLASLLVTEVVQHSVHVLKQPVFLLALDAQSAFDRCLRQILICELFKAGLNDKSLLLIDNRLASRSTVYEWNRELLGPAKDETGFEQGAINSSDYYKLYNNEQLETAQASCLGVDLGSCTVSAIGQADDVLLCSNNIDSLRLLATLTENYCNKYNVKLVPSKTKLLGYSVPKKEHLLEHAKLTNSITINNHPVKFTDEFEHVGVLRNISGNLPNIKNRIAEHKSGMNYVLSAGLARTHYGNPAASLKVHELYGVPKLFSGLASLVLSKSEIRMVDSYYQQVIQNLQRLHPRTPRCFVFLMAGCLPGEAILHQRQLTLFMMICHLPADPLHAQARHVLLSAKNSANSWFLQIREICLLYGLDHPLHLLSSPPSKYSFKHQVDKKVTLHWENLLRIEAAGLTSLRCFMASNCSVKFPHIVWSTARSSFESRKATCLARMMSGRFRSEYLTRHWSTNKQGLCLAETCRDTVGDLEHMLVLCPALAPVRARMWNLMFDKAMAFPPLYTFFLALEKSPPSTKLQFFLDPTAFQDILDTIQMCGQAVLELLCYLTRTYAYYLYREKQKLVGWWQSDNFRTIYPKKRTKTLMKKNQFNILLAGSQDVDEPVQQPNHDSSHPRDQAQSLAVPVVVQQNHGTVVHRHTVAARLAGRTLASMHHGDSAGVKCNAMNDEALVQSDPDNDHGTGGELLPGCGPVCVRVGVDSMVSGLQQPPSLL